MDTFAEKEELPYERYAVPFDFVHKLLIVDYVGKGKYCEAFAAVLFESALSEKLNKHPELLKKLFFNEDNRLLVVAKCLKRISANKVRREAFILNQLNVLSTPSLDETDYYDRLNIIPLLSIHSDSVRNLNYDPIMIYPLVDCKDARPENLRSLMLDPDTPMAIIKKYVYCIARALRACKRRNVIHRDVKPHNTVFCRERGVFFLIDWGLAEVYVEGREYTCKVGSKAYKAPELICEMPKYDFALDIWSLGVVLLGFVVGKDPFFMERTDARILYKIAEVRGSREVEAFIEKYELVDILEDELASRRQAEVARVPLQQLGPLKGNRVTPEVEQLLEGMLTVDPAHRMTLEDLLAHPWFDEVRDPK